MNTTAVWIVSCLASYFAGSVPTGYLVARAKGVNIREVGSGNTGATNVFRMIGKVYGIITLAADVLKGFLPALLFPFLFKRFAPEVDLTAAALACAACAVAGHNWSIFLGFKGGKGVATSAGALLAVAPAAVGIGLAVWVLVFIPSRFVSMASMVAAAVIAAVSWPLYGENGRLLPIALAVLAAILIWRHRTNIVRLVNGTEAKMGSQKKAESAEDESE